MFCMETPACLGSPSSHLPTLWQGRPSPAVSSSRIRGARGSSGPSPACLARALATQRVNVPGLVTVSVVCLYVEKIGDQWLSSLAELGKMCVLEKADTLRTAGPSGKENAKKKINLPWAPCLRSPPAYKMAPTGQEKTASPDRCSDSPTPAALSRSNIEIWGQGKEGRGIHRIS